MAERIYNVAVVGYGLSAKVFMVPFLDGIRLKLHAIVQRKPSIENDAEHDHPHVKVYRSCEEMLQDKAIDLVIVATPPPTHLTLCKQALEAGKHVVCEKPFTMNLEEAEILIALADEKKLMLTVFHNRRWDADFNTIVSLNHSGRLGRIAEFESHFDWHAPLPRPGWDSTWRTQAGSGAAVLYDLGSHLIDQTLQLFGMPQQVTAFLYYQRENGTQWGDADSMTLLLQYNEGPFVTLKASIMNPEPEQLRFWVRGTKGAYKKYYLDVQEPQISQGQAPNSPGFGIEPENHHGTLSTIDEAGTITSAPFPTLPAPTYKSFWKQLIESLDGRGAVPVKPESAMEVIKVIELAMKSAHEHMSIPVI